MKTTTYTLEQLIKYLKLLPVEQFKKEYDALSPFEKMMIQLDMVKQVLIDK